MGSVPQATKSDRSILLTAGRPLKRSPQVFDYQRLEDEQKEQLEAMGKLFGVNSQGKEDEARRMMHRVLNENKEEAMAKLRADQKEFMLDTLAEVQGLDRENLEYAWKFNCSCGDEVVDYYLKLMTAENEEECEELAKARTRKGKVVVIG